MKTQSLALSLVVMFLAAEGFADTRIAVLPVGGPAGAKAEGAIRKALKKRRDVEVIPAGAVKSAISKHGRKVEALARELKADVVFVSLTQKSGKNMKLNIGVYDADGARVGGNGWTLKKGDMKAVERTLWSELSSAVKKAGKASEDEEEEETPVAKKEEAKSEEKVAAAEESPRKDAADDAFEDEKPAKKEEKKSAAADEEEEEEEAPKKTAVAEKRKSSSSWADEEDDASEDQTTLSSKFDSDEPSAFGDVDAEVGMHAFTRSFSYNQPLMGAMASYRLSSGPSIAGGAEWYAGSLAGEGVASNVGLGLTAESAFGIGSQAQDGSRVGTSAYAFDIGPRFRIPVSRHKVSVGAGYGTRVFSVADTDDPVLSLVPDVSYRFISARVAGRYNVTEQLSVNGKFAYLHLLGTGELGSDRFFPRLSGAGIEAAAYVGYEVTPKWEVRVGVDMTRFFFALKPEPGDALVAGGAVDQFFAGTARIAYSL